MRRLLLIANPSASGFTGALFRDVVAILSRDFLVEPDWPNGPAATRDRARAAAEEGYDVVAAMGGDGVAHHVANGLVLSPTAMAIIPAGTTNVLGRVLGLPGKPRRAAAAVSTLPVTPTRLGHVAATGPSGERSDYATFAFGIGYDADVVETAEQRPHAKTRFGGMHYATTAAGKLLRDWRSRPANLRVTCDGKRADAVTVLASVHHPYTFFGPVPLPITSEKTEGMAALAAEGLSIIRSSEILARVVLRRSIPGRLGIHVWHDFESLRIEADTASPFHADGELLGTAHTVEVVPATGAIGILRERDQAGG